MLVHIMDQPKLEKGDGPIWSYCGTNKENYVNKFMECKKFSKGYGLKCVAIYGGISKGDQFKKLRNGAEIVIATPVSNTT